MHFEQIYDIRHQVMWPDKPNNYVISNEDHLGERWSYFVDDLLLSVISVFEAMFSAKRYIWNYFLDINMK